MINDNSSEPIDYLKRIELDYSKDNVTSKAELADILRADADFEKIHNLLQEAWDLLQHSKYEPLIEFDASMGWTSLVKKKLNNTIKDEDYEGTGIHKEYHLAPFLLYKMNTGSCMSNKGSVGSAG